VLDDLHWADQPTVQLLRHIAGAVRGRVLVVGTYRDKQLRPGQPLIGAFAALSREPSVGHIHLVGLTEPAVASISVLGVDIDDANRAPHSRVDATGTRRRLQALMASGWNIELLATELGRRPHTLHRTMTSASVTARTVHDVASLYQRLCDATPPRATSEQRAAADAAQAHAAAQGWLPPLAWDDIDTDTTPSAPTAGPSQRNDIDEIAVERALAGDHITYDDLTAIEQQEVIRRLTARGASIRDIAAQLGTTKRTVSRRRASVGAA
jgi:hypothetical protein